MNLLKSILFPLVLIVSLFNLNAQVTFVKKQIPINSPVPLPMIEDLYNVECKNMGDLDNDGDADVVAVGMKTGSVLQLNLWFLENTGGLEFEVKKDSIHLESKIPPLMADLNNDGNLDILSFKEGLSTSATRYNVALMNQGGFVFNAITLPALDTIEIKGYKMMYANNDAFPDLLVTGKKIGNINGYTAIFINDGTGNFTTAGIPLGVVQMASMQIIDKNSDGYDDIIFVGATSGGLKANNILMNNQNGTFSSSSFSTAPMYNGNIMVEDFDSDGHPDFMVSTIFGNGTPRLFINNHPSAGFSPNYSILPSVPIYTEQFHLMLDFDNDGIQDIIAHLTVGLTPDTMHLFKKGTSGGYYISSHSNFGDLKEIENLDTIDVNNDGYTDIFDKKSDIIYYNDSARGFIIPKQFKIFSPSYFRDFNAADINGDGYDDFLLSVYETNTSGVYLNQGGQYFSRMDIPFFDRKYIRSIRPVDIDGDNDIDLVGTQSNPFLLKNTGNGQYSVSFINSDPCEEIFIMNYDNQHHADLMLIQEDPNNNYNDEVRIYTTDANGNLSPAAISGLPKVSVSSTYTVGDQNNDGLDDIYIGYQETGNKHSVFINNGNGSFSNITGNFNSRQSDVFMVNMDDDPFLEVVSGHFTTGPGVFGIMDFDTTAPRLIVDPDLTGGTHTAFDLEDLNYDNRPDGVVFNPITKNLYYFINLPNGNFTSEVILNDDFITPIVHFIDFDNDGDQDFFFAADYQGINGEWKGSFYENTQSCTLKTQYDSIQACDEPITWIDGNQYVTDTSGVWMEGVDSALCDMMYYLHFENIKLNAGIDYLNSITLSSLDTGVQYQWLDCDNGLSKITGATNKTFSPAVDGNYAVMISSGDCIDTSACKTIKGIGLDEYYSGTFHLYPNPANHKFTITYDASLSYTHINIYNLHGKLILHEQLERTGMQDLDIADLKPAVYIIELSGALLKESKLLTVLER